MPNTVRQITKRLYWSKTTSADGTIVHACRTRVTGHNGDEPTLWDVGMVYVREADGLLRAEFRGLAPVFMDRDCATLDEAKAAIVASLEQAPEPAPSADVAHGFKRGQRVRIRNGYDFDGEVRAGEVVTQMHSTQPAWSVRCEFGGSIHYLRPDGIELETAPAPQPARRPAATSRRSLFGAIFGAGVFAALDASVATAKPALRGGDTNRLPDHAAFWARLPLPFSLPEAWRLLAPEVQTEIGVAVLGMHLAQYIHGGDRGDADQFHDDEIRGEACDVAHDLLNRMDDRLWSLFPDLYGPEGDHPRWAIDSGLAA